LCARRRAGWVCRRSLRPGWRRGWQRGRRLRRVQVSLDAGQQAVARRDWQRGSRRTLRQLQNHLLPGSLLRLQIGVLLEVSGDCRHFGRLQQRQFVEWQQFDNAIMVKFGAHDPPSLPDL
jgi:hypothetical protein